METEANLHLQRVYTFACVYNKMNVAETSSRLGKNIARLNHRRLMRVFRGQRFICGDAANERVYERRHQQVSANNANINNSSAGDAPQEPRNEVAFWRIRAQGPLLFSHRLFISTRNFLH